MGEEMALQIIADGLGLGGDSSVVVDIIRAIWVFIAATSSNDQLQSQVISGSAMVALDDEPEGFWELEIEYAVEAMSEQQLEVVSDNMESALWRRRSQWRRCTAHCELSMVIDEL